MAETRPQLIDLGRWRPSATSIGTGCRANRRRRGGSTSFPADQDGKRLHLQRDSDATSVIANEALLRGNYYIGTDKTVAICAPGTARASQPQRDGAFLLAVDDLTRSEVPGRTNQQGALLWRNRRSPAAQDGRRHDHVLERAMLQPVLAVDATGEARGDGPVLLARRRPGQHAGSQGVAIRRARRRQGGPRWRHVRDRRRRPSPRCCTRHRRHASSSPSSSARARTSNPPSSSRTAALIRQRYRTSARSAGIRPRASSPTSLRSPART